MKTSRTLIAIAGCHKYRDRADAQRQTWVKDVGSSTDVRFFVGTPHSGDRAPDEVWLDCPDGYADRKQKVIAIFGWAVEQGYDYLWKVDDDVYLRPERLLDLELRDYYGAVVPNGRVCFGAIYGLSRASMQKLLTPDTQAHELYEDIWVSNRLSELGVSPENLGWVAGEGGRLRMTHQKGSPFGVNLQPPHPNNDVIASWEHVTRSQMDEIHNSFNPSRTESAVVSPNVTREESVLKASGGSETVSEEIQPRVPASHNTADRGKR